VFGDGSEADACKDTSLRRKDRVFPQFTAYKFFNIFQTVAPLTLSAAASDMTAFVKCFDLERCVPADDRLIMNSVADVALCPPPPMQAFRRSGGNQANAKYPESASEQKHFKHFKRLSCKSIGQMICRLEPADWSDDGERQEKHYSTSVVALLF
jgi:hypothetical protein